MINVIIVDLVSDCITGIERYSKVIKSNHEHENIRIHHLIFESYKNLPKVLIENDRFTVNFYLPKQISSTNRYKPLYFDLIKRSLSPLVSSMQNIVWHMNHLGLSGIVQILRDTFGGKYLLHLHCLPWKYTNKNTDRYRRLHSLYQNERYDDFKKEEDTGFDYHKPDKIICVSDSAKCYLEKVHKIASSKISKIYNGIDIDAFQQPRNDLTILYAGRITKDKGILDFLDAVSEVVRSTDYFPRIKLAGYFNIPQFFIKKKYQHLDIEFLHQIDFNELKILYANSTFGVIPSLHEQCSYVAIEMAAFGLPLIVSDVDALSEIFEDRKTALFNKLVFNSDGELCADKDMFVNNIIEMIENEKLRQTISINLKNLYDDKFRSAAMRELTFRSYEGLFEK